MMFPFPFGLYVCHFLLWFSLHFATPDTKQSLPKFLSYPSVIHSPFRSPISPALLLPAILTSDLDSPRALLPLRPPLSSGHSSPALASFTTLDFTPPFPRLFLPRLRLAPSERPFPPRPAYRAPTRARGRRGAARDIFGVGGRLEPYHHAARVCFVYAGEGEAASLGSNSG